MSLKQNQSRQNQFYTACVILYLSLLPLYCSADDLPALEGESKPRNQIDWSKPIVSRGFGYKAENAQELPFEKQYKQAQIAYFFGQYDKALQLWLPLVEKNHVESIASVAWMYHAGLGTEKNLHKAYELYLQAAAKGNAVAQNNIGTLFENGELVEKDFVKAREWYRQSAENGYRFGQYNYASVLQNGLGGEKDLESAIVWYQKAASQNVKQAKDQLAVINKNNSKK